MYGDPLELGCTPSVFEARGSPSVTMVHLQKLSSTFRSDRDKHDQRACLAPLKIRASHLLL